MAASRIIAAAWQTKAADLARWTLYHLLNRDDLWGAYNPPAHRGAEPTLTITGRTGRGKKKLSLEQLAGHYTATRLDQLLALHCQSDSSTSRWFALEVSRSGEQNTSRPGDRFHAALAWAEKLQKLHMDPLLLELDGDADYLVITPLAEPVQASRLHAFALELVSDYGHRDLSVPPRLWPPEPHCSAEDPQQCLRLPGRNPTGEHWTRIWDGSAWLEGDAAIAAILKVQASPASAIRSKSARQAQPAEQPVVQTPAPVLMTPAVTPAAPAAPAAPPAFTAPPAFAAAHRTEPATPLRQDPPPALPATPAVPPAYRSHESTQPAVSPADQDLARRLAECLTTLRDLTSRHAPGTPLENPSGSSSTWEHRTDPRSEHRTLDDARRHDLPPTHHAGMLDDGVAPSPTMRPVEQAPRRAMPQPRPASVPAIDPELRRVMDTWSDLPSAVRAGILAMINASLERQQHG